MEALRERLAKVANPSPNPNPSPLTLTLTLTLTLPNPNPNSNQVADHLRSSVYFQRHRGRDWLLLNSFYWVKTVLGDELGALALQGPMLFTTSDRQYVHYRELLNESAVVPSVIPYKSHYALDDAAWIDSKYPQTAPRPLQVLGVTRTLL